MGIFIKRPLCLFCFCFIGTALLSALIGAEFKLALFVALAFGAIACFVHARVGVKRKYGLIEAAIAIIFSIVALVQSFLFIDLRSIALGGFVRDDTQVEFVVVSEEYSSRFSTKYEGKIASLDGEEKSARAYLVLEHEADYLAGDKLLLIGDVARVEDDDFSPVRDTLLEISFSGDKDSIICEPYEVFDVSVVCGRLRAFVRDLFLSRLDGDSAALSFGMLTGDSSMIETSVARDFRRVGLSHLLAVSGLHLTVLLGAVEFVLRRFYVSKAKRIVILTAFAFFLLFLSGFSLSAVRAVLMLLVAYLCYALSREPDTLTSLSVAGALILFISPLSVGSISFWLSFLATLGIVLYLEVLGGSHKIRLRGKGRLAGAVYPLFEKIIGALIVTLSANVFICAVLWLAFGEISIVSPITNLIIAPLGEAYLILTLLVFALGWIPFLGTALSFAASGLCSLICRLASYFSHLGFSVVSLAYAFAGIIIWLSLIALAILFIVKLRRRFVILLVPIVAVAIFGACLFVNDITSTDVRAGYVNQDERDALAVIDGQECVVIDISDGTYSSFYNSYEWAREEGVTEVKSVVLTHYHAKHISSLDRFFRSYMVRSVCMPEPNSIDELNVMKDILLSAEKNGVEIVIYKRGDGFSVGKELYMLILDEGKREGSTRKIIAFSLFSPRGILSYADESWYLANNSEDILALVENSSALVLGSHGPPAYDDGKGREVDYPSVVAAAKIEIFALSPDMPAENSELIVASEKDGVEICEFIPFE